MGSLVSILIPTYNAQDYIKPLINKLLDQEIDKDYTLEIIVVDSSSTDNTISIIKNNYPNILLEVIPNRSFDHGGTRNFLASLAKGDYLIFMTQDAIPFDNYLIHNLLKPVIKNKEILISYARQIPNESAKPLEVFARSFNYPEESIVKNSDSINKLGIKAFFNSNVCSLYTRECFVNFGGFPEKIILNEDMIIASKVILNGYSVAYSSKAKVYHSHNYNLKQQYKRYFDIGMAFNDTSYLLQYASNEKEGIKMVLNQIKYLLIKSKWYLIPYSLLESGVKFVAYNMGKNHQKIPLNIKKKLSAYMK